MSDRTLIPSGTPTGVEQALARFEKAMQQKPPKTPRRKPAKPKRSWSSWMFRKPSPEELAALKRMQGGDT